MDRIYDNNIKGEQLFYITKDVLKRLSPEDQALIADEGLTMEQMDALSPEEKAKLTESGDKESDVQAPDMGDKEPMDEESPDPSEKISEESKLPKSMRYGDEDQFESKLTEDGRMEELPNSKKNAIGNFDDAADQGMALLDKLSRMPEKKPEMKRKKIKQEELEGDADE